MVSSSFSAQVFRVLFWLALVGALTIALLPHPPQLPAGDKVQHMFAFAVLAVLGAGAFPDMPLPRLGERLSFFGALIEVCQSIPALHRDCDIRDWIADTLAIAVALTAVHLYRTATARRPASQS